MESHAADDLPSTKWLKFNWTDKETLLLVLFYMDYYSASRRNFNSEVPDRLRKDAFDTITKRVVNESF